MKLHTLYTEYLKGGKGNGGASASFLLSFFKTEIVFELSFLISIANRFDG
ncbi:hypothetical protein JCM19297_3543 [Nonlabens ulvanivorans]|nr:hypothetical protein [Nonlabens ulvanivorans]GAK89019.1 hypothetical protein JCM19297_3543 [Nonlabens ulvanivorans]